MTAVNTIAFDIAIRRIDERPSNHFQVPRLLIDGQVAADFNTFAVDLKELVASRDEGGERFILTCWCGAPDCAPKRTGPMTTDFRASSYPNRIRLRSSPWA